LTASVSESIIELTDDIRSRFADGAIGSIFLTSFHGVASPSSLHATQGRSWKRCQIGIHDDVSEVNRKNNSENETTVIHPADFQRLDQKVGAL
jgi:hypothetical protein